MIGRIEILQWVGKDFVMWKKELEKWTENDKSSEETKYCNILESLKKNDEIKDFVVSTLAEKTENDSTVTAILQVLGEKYGRTESDKYVSLMAAVADFKMEVGIEVTTDNLGKMMAEVKKLDLAKNLDFAMMLQFMERLEKSGKISSKEKMRLRQKKENQRLQILLREFRRN